MVSALNAAADYIEAGVKRVGVMVPSIILGGIGGRIVRGGFPLGFLQGAITGAISYGLLHPARNVLDKRTGPGKDQVHENTRWQLWALGKFAQYAVPAAVTVYYGDRIIHGLADHLPSSIGSRIVPGVTENEYNTVTLALFTNVAPAAIEHVVEWCRRAKQKK